MNELLEKELNIENMIYEIRGKQVMLDSDLAKLYQVETKRINEAVKNNPEKFPERFSWILNSIEEENLRSKISTSSHKKNYGGRRYNTRVFTEQGVAMLATILKSKIATQISIQIMDAFVSMRKYISTNLIEQKFINNMVLEHNENFKIVYNDIKLLQQSFDKLEEKRLVNEIYFNGQIYDAYSKIVDILNDAKEEVIIIDGYADRTTLDIIKNINCNVVLIIKTNSRLSTLDIDKYNKQYHNLRIIYSDNYHDRYFIIDKSIIYHCGTSINYAGSKTFSINILEDKIVKDNLIKDIIKSCKLNNNEL